MVGGKESESEIKIQDAKNFYCQLLAKINSCCDDRNHVACKKNKFHDNEDCKKCKECKKFKCECECTINDNKIDKKGECKKEGNSIKWCLSKETDEEICDGKKIRRYLKHVVPEWEYMTPNRLYNHIQKMHENSEGVRRFEIDLTWRRALYFIPLVVIFFSAFGVAFFSFQSEFGIIDSNKFIDTRIALQRNGTSVKNIGIKNVGVGNIGIEDIEVKNIGVESIGAESIGVEIVGVEIVGHIASDYSDENSIKGNVKRNEPTYKNESKKGHFILLGIAFINACLCFFLTKMNVESQRWQNNWECHIDYLQQILGFKLMQTCLRPRGGYFSIRTTNTFIGFLSFLVWYFAMVVLFYLLLEIKFDFQPEYYKSLYDSLPFSSFNYFLVIIFILTLFLALTVSLILILAAPRTLSRLTPQTVCKTILKIISRFRSKAVYKTILKIISRLTPKTVCKTILKIISKITLKIISKITHRVVLQIIAIILISTSVLILILTYPMLAPILAPILILMAISIFINDIYCCLTGESIFKEAKKIRVSKDNRFYMRELEIFREGDEDLKIYEDKKGVYSIIIASSSVIIFYIPFVILIALYSIRKFCDIRLTFDLMIILAAFIPCVSIFFSWLIERYSKKFSIE